MTRTLSVVAPVYNEGASIQEFYARTSKVIAELQAGGLLADQFEIIFVDDGSSDDSVERVVALNSTDARVKLVVLSRNFGKERALAAGLDHCDGDLVVLIDSDLQHPPELIAALMAKANEGFDVVCALRRHRSDVSLLRKFAAAIYHQIFFVAARLPNTPGSNDFRLMTRAVVEAVRELRESERYNTGILAWVGFPSTTVEYDPAPRKHGRASFGAVRLATLALDGITSFSIAPLRLATLLGFVVGAFALFSAVYYLVRFALHRDPVAGFPTIVITMLFLGSAQLICLGIIGEYVGRTFRESKDRPLYIVRRMVGTSRTTTSARRRESVRPAQDSLLR